MLIVQAMCQRSLLSGEGLQYFKQKMFDIKYEEMKLLVIGGTGVLSTAVVECGIRKGIHVTMINRGRNPQYLTKGANLLKQT
jgi:hypothetical protein